MALCYHVLDFSIIKEFKMTITILANIIAFAGCMIMVLIGLIKTKRKMLIAQNIQMGLQTIANILLGGYSGAISSTLGIIRNTVTLKRELTRPIKIIFIALQGVLTILFGNPTVLINWLPFASNAIFISMLHAKNPVVIKVSIMVSTACWIVYDLHYANYVTCAFDILTVISNLIGIFMICKYSEQSKRL